VLHELVLIVHVVAGAGALLLGPVAFRARKRRGVHTHAGEAYHWVVLVVAGSAVTLALFDWSRLWWLAAIAVGSYALALAAYGAAKRRPHRWLHVHVAGQGGSYIALVTAVLVVNLGGPLVLWVLPTLVGTPVLAWLQREIWLGRRPRHLERNVAVEQA
jgi:hypothetical protein